jgi:BirA family biotin operon repressor/biotin-[acetyl-CoA-carboxylase] ligase
LYRYDEVDSTNDVVESLAKEGAPEGTTVMAERQRQGRGRQGRAWFSPGRGNLYVSVLLRPKISATDLPALVPAFGLGVAEALEEFVSVRAELKWPNDVLVRGRKIAGILTESVIQGGEVNYVVVGIGVNLNIDNLPEDLADTATSVRLEIGTQVDHEAFVPVFFRQLDLVYRRFNSQGFAALTDAWNTRDALRERQVRLDTGMHILEGIAKGINPSGALILETPEGRQQISAGEIL